MNGSLRRSTHSAEPTEEPIRSKPESQHLTVHARNYDIFEPNKITLELETNRPPTTAKTIHLNPGEYTTDHLDIHPSVTSIRASLTSTNTAAISLDQDTEPVVLIECGNGIIDITTAENLPYKPEQLTI